MTSTELNTPRPHKSSNVLLIVAWLVVSVPALWGVTQTFKKSLALFNSPPPAAAPAQH